MNGLIIVVGASGSGKTTAGEELEALGYWRLSSGGVIRDMAMAAGRQTDRRGLQEYGFDLLNERGHEWYGRHLLGIMATQPWCVVEGLRSRAAARVLREAVESSLLVFIECDYRIRVARVCKRDRITPANFRDMELMKIESEVPATRPLADFIILNDDDMVTFRRRIRLLGTILTCRKRVDGLRD